MITILVVGIMLILVLVGAGVVYHHHRDAEGRRRIRIEQERLLCQQRLLYMTQVTMAAMRAAARQHGRDDA
jgi:hypothetical protein